MEVRKSSLHQVADICRKYWTNISPPSTLSSDRPSAVPAEIGTALRDFDLIEEVGNGATGIVYRARSRLDGRTYALKRVSTRHVRAETLREVRMLKRCCAHPGILQFYGFFVATEEQELVIVTEFAEGGDLERFVKRHIDERRRVAERDIWGLAWQLALGLLHLHARSVIHRDVKPLNILLFGQTTAKLGDLGESVLYDRSRALSGILLSQEA
ncbi:MAG: protein kinase [Candidatus Pacebacteria bacterium]|nr:protein kinase [Candidatus Paceibacterota bacterium]